MLCSPFDPLLLFNDFNFISNFALFGLRICVGLISTYMRKTGNYLGIVSMYKIHCICKKERKLQEKGEIILMFHWKVGKYYLLNNLV